jgi:hypothetical protein
MIGSNEAEIKDIIVCEQVIFFYAKLDSIWIDLSDVSISKDTSAKHPIGVLGCRVVPVLYGVQMSGM